MKKQNPNLSTNPLKEQYRGGTGKPEIRDDLDSRKNEEYKTKREIKKAEKQNKDKQKETKGNK